MNRLYNLESHLEHSTYVALFEESSNSMVQQGAISLISTKQWIKKYKDLEYLTPSPVTADQVETLVQDSIKITHKIGESLNGVELYLVQDDIDILTLGEFLDPYSNERYIYKSAYYYWCFNSEIQEKKDGRPIIIINLDAGSINNLVPITLEIHQKSKRIIPLLKPQDKVDFKMELVELHQKIFNEIATQILQDNFPSCAKEKQTVDSLCNYLKRISFINLVIEHSSQDNFDMIIELSQKDAESKKIEIFYKAVNIDISIISEIIISQLPIERLSNLICRYSNFQFFIVSKYSLVPGVHHALPDVVNLLSNSTSFNLVWEQKKLEGFPLFGITLDRIRFPIVDKDQQGVEIERWIELNAEGNNISYEGKPISIIGKVDRSDNIRDYFIISKTQKYVKLPIEINGQKYTSKVFEISIQNPQRNADTRVRIIFDLEPGKFPNLKVIDTEGKYNIKTRLVEPTPPEELRYSYTPYDIIIKMRSNNSKERADRLQLDIKSLSNYFLKINQFIERKNLPILPGDMNLPTLLRRLHDLLKSGRYDILQYINPKISTNQEIENLILTLESLDYSALFDHIIPNDLYSYGIKAEEREKREKIEKLLILTGKLYYFSQYLNLSQLINRASIKFFTSRRSRGLYGQFLLCFARTAINKNLQSIYFDLFDDMLSGVTGKDYLWGYGRILRWYFDFKTSSDILDYKKHKNKILSYLLSYEKKDASFLQNAFLSLIHLLGFRELDQEFCSPETQEFDLARRVIDKFKTEWIGLNQVDKEKSLNVIYQEMLEGNIPRGDLDDFLRAGSD